MNSYLKTVIAKITGDKAQDIAASNYRKAKSILKQQTASQENTMIELEEKLAQAEEKLQNAKYPAVKIEDARVYLNTIVEAQEEVDDVKAEIQSVKDFITYLGTLNDEFDAEVPEGDAKA